MIRDCIAQESSDTQDAAIEMVALQRLMNCSRPGNIRALRNTIRTCLALCDGGIIRIGDLPPEIRYEHVERLKTAGQPALTLQSAERAALLRIIEAHDWVMSRVAAHLNISRNTLYRKI